MPRIRSLQPDLWEDEAFEGLTRDARLLFVGLVTQADDEGRLKAAPALLKGKVYPYDHDLDLREIATWVRELAGAGLVRPYEVEGRTYLHLPGWGRNQRISHPSPSKLPAPPEGDAPTPASLAPERPEGGLFAATDAPPPPPEAPPGVGAPERPARARKAKPDPDALPAGFPEALAPAVEAVLPILVEVAEQNGARAAILPTRLALGRVFGDLPRKDHVAEAQAYRAWQLDRARTGHKDPVKGYRNWLGNCADVARPSAPAAPVDRKSQEERDAEALRKAGLA